MTKKLHPVKEEEKNESCCHGGCCCNETDGVLIEYLYLDLESCERCVGTDQVLDKVMETLTPALNLAGFSVDYRKVLIDSEETAREYEFLSSPTIRVNGMDICSLVKENECGCCGDISGTDVECRVFEYKGKTYEVPPAEMLASSVLEATFSPDQNDCCCSEYKLPKNLKNFFNGKKQNECKCGKGCC